MEHLVISLEGGDEKSIALSRSSVIGKVIANMVVNKRGVMTILRGIWPVETAPVICDVGKNKFGISFKIKEIRERAI
ncbi:hypothetical protein CRYUN_Cryun38cG0024200 [Craigia yunnanensis]